MGQKKEKGGSCAGEDSCGMAMERLTRPCFPGTLACGLDDWGDPCTLPPSEKFHQWGQLTPSGPTVILSQFGCKLVVVWS